MGREAGTSTVLGPCVMARASRSSSVLNGTCSGFGTRPLDTMKQEHNVNVNVHSMLACTDGKKKTDFCNFPQHVSRL